LAWSPAPEPNNIAATPPYDFSGNNLTPYAPVGTLAYHGRHNAGGPPVTRWFRSADSAASHVLIRSDPAIRELHAEGLRVVMLTGDNRTTAEVVVRKLGIDDVIAEVLPTDKASAIEALQRQVRFVAMAGDGINDAPALAKAQVGIAMGTGTDVAMESAGVTLVKGDLRGIVRARRLSRATMRNNKQNLLFAFVYNALGVPIAAGILYPFFGILLSPMIAAAAMNFSSVSVITNALRFKDDRGGQMVVSSRNSSAASQPCFATRFAAPTPPSIA